jgi:hypothetical protein
VYELHSRDKQKALDAIVEGRAAETRAESPDGNLPDLESAGDHPSWAQEGDK